MSRCALLDNVMDDFDSGMQAKRGCARPTHAEMQRLGRTPIKRGVDPVSGKSYTLYADEKDLPTPDHDYRRPAEEMLHPTRYLVNLQGGHHPDEIEPERDLVEADDLEPDGLNSKYEDYRQAFIADLASRNLASGVREALPEEFGDGQKTGYLGFQKIMRWMPYLPAQIRPSDPREKPEAIPEDMMAEGKPWNADPRRPQQRTGTWNRAGNATMDDSRAKACDTETTRMETLRQDTEGEITRGRMPITVPGFNAGSTKFDTDRNPTQRPGEQQEVARGRMPITVPGFNAGSTKFDTDRNSTQRSGEQQEVARGRMPITVQGFNAGTVRTSTERPGTQRPGEQQEVARGRMPITVQGFNAGTVRTSTERPGTQRPGEQQEVARGRMPATALVFNAGGVRTSTERPGTQRPGGLNEMPLLQSIVGTVAQGLQAAKDAFTQRSRRGNADSVTTDNLAAYRDGLAKDISAPGIQTEAPTAVNTRKSYFETRIDQPSWGADNGDANGFDLFGAQSLRRPRSNADDAAMQAKIMRESHDHAMYLPNPGYLA